MRLLLVGLVATVGCLRSTSFHCASSADCGAGGTCEPTFGFCSFTDPNCPGTNRRFGDLSGPYANQCVGGGSGMQLDAGLDARVDAPSGAKDTDGDGVPDSVDNCPTVPNPGQENEDGDAFGDVCDPCPPDVNNADGDGDGVGDKCDPRPAMAGDRIALFEGFHHGLPAGWESVGTWTQIGDDLAGDDTAGSALIAVPSATSTKETVSAAITLVSVVANQVNAAGVFDDRMTGSTSSVACETYIANGVTPSPGLALLDTNNVAGSSLIAYQMTPGSTYQFTERRDAMMYKCTAATGAATANLSKSVAVTNTPYSAGVAITQSAVRVKWLMIVTNN